MGIFTVVINLISARSPGWLVAALNPNRQIYRGAKIDAKAFAVGRLVNSIRPPDVLPTIQNSRIQMQKAVDAFDLEGPSLTRVTNLEIDGADGPIKARLYSDTAVSSMQPAMVFFHGGGFIQGGLDSHNETCAKLAKWWGGTVIAVDYRLAPEHPYPAGVDDCTAAYVWVVDRAADLGLDPKNIGVCGDSAGGCFAAVVAQQKRNTAGPVPRFQVLIYPVTDGHLNTPSMAELEQAYILPKNRIIWYRDQYAGDFKDYANPKFSPLFSGDFKGLPDCYMLTGGFDPLVDDGQFYVDRLRDAGVAVTHRHYPGQVHAFVNLTKVVPDGSKALREIAAWLRLTCPT